MSGPRYVAQPVLDEDGSESAHVVVDSATGGHVAYFAHGNDAYWTAALLDALASGAWPDDVLLGAGEHRRFLRRIELRYPAVCFRCGRSMRAGAPAFWHPVSRVVRHVGSCQRAALTTTRRRAA